MKERWEEDGESNLFDWCARRPVSVLAAVLLVFGLYFGQSMLYTVAADEEAVVQRFGEYVRTEGPGLHVKLPALVESVTRVPVKSVQTVEFGFQTEKAGKKTVYNKPTADNEIISRMLTADLSLAHVEWTVLYRVNDARKYLFNVGGDGREQKENIVEVVRSVAENVMRRKVGDISIDDAVMTGREKVGAEGKVEMQKMLDSLDIGVTIVRTDVQQSQPPTEVVPAWDAVNQARQDNERIINEAAGFRNELVPAARGEQKRAIREAEGYAKKIVETATGRAEAFRLQAAEYKKSPETTQRRLYIEAMQRVLGQADITVVDASIGGRALPFIDLNGTAAKAKGGNESKGEGPK
jgi:membrane protease subunit HflK